MCEIEQGIGCSLLKSSSRDSALSVFVFRRWIYAVIEEEKYTSLSSNSKLARRGVQQMGWRLAPHLLQLDGGGAVMYIYVCVCVCVWCPAEAAAGFCLSLTDVFVFEQVGWQPEPDCSAPYVRGCFGGRGRINTYRAVWGALQSQ